MSKLAIPRALWRHCKCAFKSCIQIARRSFRGPSTADLGFWYYNVPVGINMLSSKMSRVSGESECSEVCTNHCLRATTTTVLAHAGIEHNDICAVTGHRYVDTIRQHVSLPWFRELIWARSYMIMAHCLHRFGSASTSEEVVTASTSTKSIGGAVSSAYSENVVVPQILSVYSNQK